jgi:oxalate---CoA ligase
VEADPYPVQTLAAYVTTESGQPTLTQTRELVVRDRTQTPTHCSVEVLPDMPLTDTGEIDYARLTASHRTAERVAPRDDLERQMAKIWQELLNVPAVSIHDNFFELGGSSLLAVQLFSRIETEFGKNLPLATLFQATTVEDLTNVLREKQDNAPSWSPLVAIQPNGTKPPLFCPHAAGGNVIIYRSLVPYLGPDQPVYGLQPKGLNGKDSPLTRFEDIADYYIDAIRKHQPEGPYHLAGLSSGGGLAVAIAQRLHSQGQQVGFVGLFDSYARGYPKMLPATSLPRYLVNRLLQVVDNQVNTLRLIEPEQRWAFVKEKISIIPQEVQKLLRQYYWWTKQPLPKALQKVQKANKKAVKSYVPKVYPGNVTVFRAEKQPVGCIPDLELGWGRYVSGGIEVHTVPGYHANVIREPFVKVLGQKLKACLEAAYHLQETTDQ